MAERIVLIPIVRVHTSHHTIAKALDAMLDVGEIDIDADNLHIEPEGKAHVVIVNGEEDEVTIAGAAGYIKGWFDARGVKATIL